MKLDSNGETPNDDRFADDLPLDVEEEQADASCTPSPQRGFQPLNMFRTIVENAEAEGGEEDEEG